jgi:ribosomal-protein-serine acetyltransferase
VTARCAAHGAVAEREVCAHLLFAHAAGVNVARASAWCDGCHAAAVSGGSRADAAPACPACWDAALARNREPSFALRVDARTRLRTPSRADAEPLFALIDAGRAYLRRWLPWVDASTRAEHTRGFLELAIAAGLDGRSLVLVIEHDGALAGTAGFNTIDAANRSCEIGYWLREDFQGRGVVTGACRALVRHAFDSLALNCVKLAAATENAKSRAIPERLGFHLDGVLREQEWVDGRFVDHAVYTLLRRDGASAASAS